MLKRQVLTTFKRHRIAKAVLAASAATAVIIIWELIFNGTWAIFRPQHTNQEDAGPVVKNFQYCAKVEERRLRQYVDLTTKDSKPKAVITILANKAQVSMLRQSLKKLHANFNKQFAYPVIVFHEADFLPHLPALRDTSFNARLNMSSIFFRQVDLSVPCSYLEKFGQPPEKVCGGKQSLGYRSMCRFHAMTIYEEPMMRHFDYQWRLDDDSVLDAKISFDVFAYLRDRNCSYGYYESMIDQCAHETYNMTVDYIRMRDIRPTFFHRLKWWEIFFNNFEISDLKIWRSKRYRDFVQHVDSLGGFYAYRWGDAPIKTLALSMFVPASEICQYAGISYKHSGLNSHLKTQFLS